MPTIAKIYQNEINDGLSSHFEKPLSIAYEIPVFGKVNIGNYVGKVKSVANVVGKLHEDDFLYEFPSILVTAGVWNKNDQIFDKLEVWKARFSPLNKPSNLNHQPDKVVAHSSRVFPITDEEEARIIPETIDGKPNDIIPDIYHLLTVDNFYKYNIKAYQAVNKEYSEKIQNVYNQIVDAKLAVSMECIFDDFDYAIIMADGTQKIIKRDAYSSFLTKKLRAFGGNGIYEGHRIGMLMRNIMFTGKGITDNPANESSVIFGRDTVAFASQSFAKSEDIFKVQKDSAYIISDNGETNMNLEQALAKITELETKLAEVTTSSTAATAELAKVKPEVEKVTAELATAKANLETKTTELNGLVTEKVAAEKALKETTEKLATAQTEVSTLKAEKVKIERISTIKEKLGLDAKEAEENYLVVASLDDATFGSWVDNTKKITDKNNSVTKKEIEELNKKLAEAQLATAKVTDPGLAIASVTVDEAKTKLQAGIKSVFTK